MTANLPAERTAPPKPQIMAGGPVAALVPQSLDEAFRVSQAIASSGLAPKGMERPETIMVAIMAGAELGLAPFQALQSFAVVNGRPTLWGDGLMAVARAQGIQARETLEGGGESMVATCSVTRPDTGEVIERSFSVADAKKASLWGKQGPWQSYPRRMLQMRARAWALRDGCADMLRGFQVREEAEDYAPIRDVTARAAPNLAARLAAPIEGAVTEGFTAHHTDSATEAPLVSDTSAPATVAEEAVQAVADESFPGDRSPPTPGEGAAEPSEPIPGDEEKGSAAVIVWQRRLIEDMDGLTGEQLDHLLANPSDQEMFAELERDQAQLAMDLNKAITRRRKELA